MLPSDNKSAVQLVVHPAWILPIIPRGEVLSEHSLVVQQGRIAALLPTPEAEQIEAEQHVHLPSQVLMPGLVNAHGHSAMSLLRGVADDAPLLSWLQDHIWPLEAHFVSEEFVADGTDLALAELLLGGTTTLSDMYFFPEVTAQRVQSAGMRAQLVFPIIDVATAWARDSDSCLEKGLALRDDYRDDDLVDVGFGLHATYSVSEATLRKVSTLTNELDAPMQIHLHETRGEVQSAVEATGERPVALLDRLGVLGPRSQCVHMTSLSSEDIQR
ncbi:MAG: amidohydrolase family protein, partial [Luminiphilus sp.]